MNFLTLDLQLSAAGVAFLCFVCMLFFMCESWLFWHGPIFFISKAVHDLLMTFHGFPLLRSAINIYFSVLQNFVS